MSSKSIYETVPPKRKEDTHKEANGLSLNALSCSKPRTMLEHPPRFL